jgi:hypothetical protein
VMTRMAPWSAMLTGLEVALISGMSG